MADNQESLEDVFSDVLPDKEEHEESEPTNQKEDTPSGYMSKEAWIEAGKDPDEWVSQDVFKERTQRIKEVSRLKREMAQQSKDFENRLKNVATLTRVQAQRELERLSSLRDEAIDLSDREEVKRLDKRMAEIEKEKDLTEEKKVESVKPPEVYEWEEENPWINDNDDPRTPIAQKAFREAMESGKTLAGSLRAAERAVQSLSQQDREIKKKPAVSMADSSRSVASKNDSPSISWSSLSRDEVDMYNEVFSHAGMSKQEFLKTVADERRGSR